MAKDQYIVIAENDAYRYQGGFNEIIDFVQKRKQGIVLEVDGNIIEFKSLNVFDMCNVVADQLIKGDGNNHFVTCGIHMESNSSTKESPTKSVLKSFSLIKKLKAGKGEDGDKECKYLELSYKGIELIKKFFVVESIDEGLMHLINILLVSKVLLNNEYMMNKMSVRNDTNQRI